jgi:hypothetical protein
MGQRHRPVHSHARRYPRPVNGGRIRPSLLVSRSWPVPADVRLAAPGGFSASFPYPAFTAGPDSLHVPPRVLVPFAAFRYARTSPASMRLDVSGTTALCLLLVIAIIPQVARNGKSARQHQRVDRLGHRRRYRWQRTSGRCENRPGGQCWIPQMAVARPVPVLYNRKAIPAWPGRFGFLSAPAEPSVSDLF